MMEILDKVEVCFVHWVWDKGAVFDRSGGWESEGMVVWQENLGADTGGALFQVRGRPRSMRG